MRTIVVSVVVTLTFIIAVPGTLVAQGGQPGFASQAADAIETDGYWDQDGVLDSADFGALATRFAPEFAFVFVANDLAVDGEPNLNPAQLLSRSVLDELTARDVGPSTVIMFSGQQAGISSEQFPATDTGVARQLFDADKPLDSFEQIASALQTGELPDLAPAASLEDDDGGVDVVLVTLIIVAVALGAASLYVARSKKSAVVTHTAPARDDTAASLTAMSDLILDLEPRIVIAERPELKRRFADASRTYSEVRERAEDASRGHEIADIRKDIAKAQWKLDVIEAELDGTEPPAEPFTFDNSGSAWDSTRGSGPRNRKADD